MPAQMPAKSADCMVGRNESAETATAERGRLAAAVATSGKGIHSFEPDFFQQNLLRIVDDVVTVIKGSIELWPTLVEICYFHKSRQGLPQTRVANRSK